MQNLMCKRKGKKKYFYWIFLTRIKKNQWPKFTTKQLFLTKYIIIFESSRNIFLEIYNEILLSCSWPLDTQPDPQNSNNEPLNCRQIAHNICVCRTMGRRMKNRLMSYLEFNVLITFQSGFRNKKSRGYQTRLETLIKEAFIKKKYVADVFSDLEKAYNTAWK